MTILLAVGDCFGAFLLGPVLDELRARGVAFRVAAGALEQELAGLRRQLGLGGCVRAVAHEDELAARKFADELLAGPTASVVYIGVSTFTRCLAEQAAQRDVRVVHLDAGVQAFGRPVPPQPRANAFCVTGDLERHVLLASGALPSDIAVVGDLVAAAVASVPRAEPSVAHGLALVIEREPVASKVVLEMQEHTGLPSRPAPDRTAAVEAWIEYVAAAQVVFTDSVGWQRIAVALGVPCVVSATSGLWAPGVAAGLVTQMEPTAECMPRVFQRAARQPRGKSVAATGVAQRIVDVVLATAKPAAVVLPSDGDASGRTFTNEEAALVTMVLQRGTLNSTRGTMVTTFEQRFAQWLGRKHAIACASGSAAMHCAIAALQLAAGDEVITTPITDMGALTPILYEGAVPVFADVDPFTLNVTAATVAARLTHRTRAIVVTHLFGLPCELAALRELATRHHLPLIEDAAQAFGATYDGRLVGTFGAIAAFSLQQGKHITTGEGGIVATDDDALARRLFLFVNKAWGYGDARPDHYFPALNYRLTELQGAVAVAQLPKLDWVVAARRHVADSLRRALALVPGLTLPQDPQHGTHSYWKFAFQVDPERVPGGAIALGKRMQAAGIACVPRYIQKPAFECQLFVDWKISPVTALPLQHNPRGTTVGPLFHRDQYPGAVRGLEHVVVLPINERYTAAHVHAVASAIAGAVGELQHA